MTGLNNYHLVPISGSSLLDELRNMSEADRRKFFDNDFDPNWPPVKDDASSHKAGEIAVDNTIDDIQDEYPVL